MPDFLMPFMNAHPRLRDFIEKLMKDNIGLLASAVSWTVLTSIVPIIAGLVGISGFVLRDPATQASVVNHLSAALSGVLKPGDIRGVVRTTVNNKGIFGIIGIAGVLWGGSNIGGVISTVFQPVFRVRGRDILPEKAIDIGMIFIFTLLMLTIIVATTAGAMVNRLFGGTQISGATTFVIGTAVSLLAGFALFAIIYMVFPNVKPRLKFRNVWPGATIAAVLFQILSLMWPIYASVAHFKRYSAVLFPIVVLTAWIYFFALILMIGAEFVSFGVLREAAAEGVAAGPTPDGTVPQRPPTDEQEAVERRRTQEQPGA